MNDMSSVIIPKSDQINAETLLSGPMTVTVKDVSIRGGEEQPVSIALEETNLFFRPCKSMSRVLVAAWGADAKAYVGRSMTLYRDPTVKWGGLEVGGIRISHMSHLDRAMTMALTASKGNRKPFTVKPLADEAAAKPDKAAQYAAGYIAELEKITVADALESLVTRQAGKLAKLRAARPELAANVDLALTQRREALSSDFDDFADTSPSPAGSPLSGAATGSPNETDATEGPSQPSEHEGRGEANNTPDDHPARQTAADIISKLKRAGTTKRLDELEETHAADVEAMPDDVRIEVAEALSAARERLSGGQ